MSRRSGRMPARRAPLAAVVLTGLAPGSAWAGACARLADCTQNDAGGGRLLLLAAGCVMGLICCLAADPPGAE